MSVVYYFCIYMQSLSVNPESLEWERIHQDWVAAGHDARTYQHPPLINAMGHRSFWVRQSASTLAGLMGRGYLGQLVAAQRHKDPEVRNRARVLIDAMYRCRFCRGTGLCPRCDDDENPPEQGCKCNWQNLCFYCKGGGDLRDVISRRVLMPNGNYVNGLFPRPIFPTTP